MSTWHFTLKKLPVQYENNQSQTDRLPLTGCIGGLRSPIYRGRQLLSLNHYLVGTHVLLDMRQTLRTWLHVRGNTPHNPAVVHQRGYHSNKKTRSPSCRYSDGKVTASIEYRSNDVTKNFFFCISAFWIPCIGEAWWKTSTAQIWWESVHGGPEIWPHEYLISPTEIIVNWPGS